jgi:hypothetical protein
MASAKVRVPCRDARGRLAPRRRRLGLYFNRTDFIRTAIRNQLATHAKAVRQTLVLGVQHLSRRDLEAVRDAGSSSGLRCWGWRASPTTSPRSWPSRPSNL